MKKIIMLLLLSTACILFTQSKDIGFSPLMHAVQNQDIEKSTRLINQKADVNYHTGYDLVPGKTALMIASEQANIPLMKLLINAGADVSAHEGWDQPHAGKPVLRYAIDSGKLEAVQLLLKHGAQVNTFTECPIIHQSRSKANERNLTLLACAINSQAPIEIIKALIQAGADVNKAGMFNKNLTPLMVAAFRGYDKAIALLLDAGADQTIQNTNDGNRTVLDYAKEQNHQSIISLLSKTVEKRSALRSFWNWMSDSFGKWFNKN